MNQKATLEEKVDKLVEKSDQHEGMLKTLSGTMGDLSKTVGSLTKTVQHVSDNLDALAVITKKGFEQVDKRLNNLEVKTDRLERGQEDIKLRLDNVAYRFELVELQRRVVLLEKKAGFSK